MSEEHPRQRERAKKFWPTLAAITAIVAVAALTYGDVLSYWFVGVDVFPLILSNRLESVLDLGELLTRQYLAAYSEQEISGSVGVRPVGSLLFALDYWVWGLRPFGYHLTDLAVHVLNASLVFLLARRLRFRQATLVAFFAAVLFARHPLQTAAVPLISGRYDLALCTFSILIVWAWLRYVDSPAYRRLALALILGVLALASKETAVVLLPIAILTAATGWIERGRSLRQTWLPILIVTVVFIGYLGYRQLVVGGVGGYPLTTPELPGALPLTLRRFFDPLVYPLPLLASGQWGQAAANAVTLLVTVALFAIAGVGLLRYFTSWRPRSLRRMAEALQSDFEPFFLVSSWTLAYLALYGSAYLLTGIFKPLYLYVTSAVWCISLSAATVHLGTRFATQVLERRAASWATLRSGALFFIALILMLFALVGPFRSLMMHRWATGGRAAREYVEAIRGTLAQLPRGATLFLINLPHGIDCTGPPCIGWTHLFEDYSLDSWRRLTHPGQELTFVAISTLRLESADEPVLSRAFYDPENRVLTVRTRGGRAEPPWDSERGRYFDTEIKPEPGRRSQVTARFKDESLARTYYFFDIFEPRRLYSIGADGVIRPVGE